MNVIAKDTAHPCWPQLSPFIGFLNVILSFSGSELFPFAEVLDVYAVLLASDDPIVQAAVNDSVETLSRTFSRQLVQSIAALAKRLHASMQYHPLVPNAPVTNEKYYVTMSHLLRKLALQVSANSTASRGPGKGSTSFADLQPLTALFPLLAESNYGGWRSRVRGTMSW